MLHPRALLRFAVLAALAALPLAGGGCDRPDDQPALRADLLAAIRSYDTRLEELARRADAVDLRRRALPHDTLDSAPAEHALAQARSAIGDRRGYLTSVRARLAGPGPASSAELQRLLAELRRRLDDGATEAIADLDAAESWVAVAEQQRRQAAPPAAAPAAEPESDPEPAGRSGARRSPPTDSSGAPIR